MRTQEVLEKLEKYPKVKNTLDLYNILTHHEIDKYAAEARHYIYGYIKSLVDLEILTERERGVAYLYFVR